MKDLRIPIGFFFALLGVILMAVGFFRPDLHARLAGSDVNVFAGLAMLAFGGVMLWLARRAA